MVHCVWQDGEKFLDPIHPGYFPLSLHGKKGGTPFSAMVLGSGLRDSNLSLACYFLADFL